MGYFNPDNMRYLGSWSKQDQKVDRPTYDYRYKLFDGTVKSGWMLAEDALPGDMSELEMSWGINCASLLPFPAKLRKLTIKGFHSLTALPDFPDTLQYLELRNLSKLETVPDFPDSLKILKVEGCSRIKSLPKLPPELDVVSISGLYSERIQELTGNGNEVQTKRWLDTLLG